MVLALFSCVIMWLMFILWTANCYEQETHCSLDGIINKTHFSRNNPIISCNLTLLEKREKKKKCEKQSRSST